MGVDSLTSCAATSTFVPSRRGMWHEAANAHSYVGRTPVRLSGGYRYEPVLGVARRDEDEPAHRNVARVPDGMACPPGDENEAARADR